MKFDEKLFRDIEKNLMELGELNIEEMHRLQCDLNDLMESSEEYIEWMQQFRVMNLNDEDKVIEILVNLETNLEHFRFHINSALPLINKILSKISKNK